MYPEYEMPTDEQQAFMEDLRGCADRAQAREQVRLEGRRPLLPGELHPALPQERTVPSSSWSAAIFDADPAKYPSTDTNVMFFHYKYLYEATGRHLNGTGTYNVEIDDPDQAGEVSKAIDALFENSDAQTRTETEKAFAAGFISMAGNLALLLNGIGLAVAFTILLVTANTMSMAVRERRTEIAVLKTARLLQRAGDGAGGRGSGVPGFPGRARRHRREPGHHVDAHQRPGHQGRPRRASASPSWTCSPPVAVLGFGVALFLGFAAGVRARPGRLPRADHRHAADGLTPWPFPSPTTSATYASAGRSRLLAIVGHRARGGRLRRAPVHVGGLHRPPCAPPGATDNAIIVQRGSGSELTSGVPLDHRNLIIVDDRVARGPDGQALASWELGGRGRPAQDQRTARRPT